MLCLNTSFKKISLTAISSLFIICLIGCKKSDNPIPVTNLGQAINAPVGKLVLENSSYNGSSRLEATPNTYINNGYIYITANFRSSQTISITIAGNSTGSYKLGTYQNSSITYRGDKTYSTSSSGAPSNAGTITITEIDRNKKTITGTYNFDDKSGSSSYSSSAMSGSFNQISYSDTPPPKPKSSMELTLDNVKLTGTPTATLTSYSILINCSFSNGAKVTLNLNDAKIGSYPLGYSSYSEASLTLDGVEYSTDYYYYSNAGTVSITDINIRNRTISGIFSFSASNSTSYYSTTKTIEGKFDNVPY